MGKLILWTLPHSLLINSVDSLLLFLQMCVQRRVAGSKPESDSAAAAERVQVIELD